MSAAPTALPGVLVVDDSSVVRRLVGSVISAEPGLHLSGYAANGAHALEQIATLAPDVVVLDVEMPVLDGLGALRRIKATWPRLPVVMYSTLTGPGTATTVEALVAGADDFACKPTATAEGLTEALRQVRADLVPRLLGLVGRSDTPGPPAAPAPRAPGRQLPRLGVDAVVVATSTGGPAALTTIAPHLPADLPVPVLITQHMPPTFTGLFAAHLSRVAPFPVTEVVAPTPVVPGHAYLATGGRHMALVRHDGALWAEPNDDPPEQSCRPSADVLFRSAAATCGARLLGLVLTGMGRDGLDGSRHVKAAGGVVAVQDEASSAVWGMPGAVAKADLADHVLALEDVAGWLAGSLGRLPAASAGGSR